MKKLFSLLIVIVFLFSLVPLGHAALTTAGRIEPRLRVCVDYLNKNTNVRNPIQKCSSLSDEEINCVTFLKGEGVEDSETKCGQFFKVGAKIIKERSFIADAIAEQIQEWKLKKVDRLIRSRPESAGSIGDFIRNLTQENAEKFFSLGRAKQKEMIDMNEDVAVEELDGLQLKKVSINRWKKRTIPANTLTKIRKRLETATENFETAKNTYSDKKTQFLSQKTRLASCADSESADCVDLRNKIRAGAEEFLLQAIEIQIQYLTKIRERILESESIEEETSQELIAEIDERIEELGAAKDDLAVAETKDEIKDVVQTVKGVWSRTRNRAILHGVNILNKRMEAFLIRTERLEKVIDAALADLEEQGVDVSSIDSKMDLYSTRLAEANEKYEEAKTYIEEAYEIEDDDQGIGSRVSATRAVIREANASLKEAIRLLKEILLDLEDLGADLEEPDEDLEDDEEYIVEEVETEEGDENE